LFVFDATVFRLTALSASGPDQTIVGAPGATNTYADANGSIAGNNPHNPFLAINATFQIAGLGVTEQSEISNVVLFFGTGPIPISAVCNDGCAPGVTIVPEPTSLGLLGAGLFGFASAQRMKRARGKPTL
jgi:hypothetical protein